jgi:type I restriction enzyme S subunit
MSQWITEELGKLIKTNLSSIGKDYTFQEIAYLDTGSITKGKIDGYQFINLVDAPSRAKRLVQENDIIYSAVRPIQRHFGFITAPPENLVVSTGFVVITCNQSELNPKYLYYYLTSDPIVEELDVIADASTSAYPSLKPSDIEKLALYFPSDIDEQKAIAAVLSILDDKIDLLHRQNKTLEAMAETLFRQWFIEEAQEDWETKPLSGVANFLNGLACQKFPPKNDLEKLPVLKIKELSSGISESSDWANSEVKPEYIVENGDVIFAWSASLMVKVWDGDRCVLNQHLFKVTSDDFPKWFYLMWCKHHLDEFISISSSHATTMGHIKRGDLDTAMVLVPSPEEIKTMSEKMAPLLNKQIAISKQRTTLEKLRDTLLPKLMSGEVRVAY